MRLDTGLFEKYFTNVTFPNNIVAYFNKSIKKQFF